MSTREDTTPGSTGAGRAERSRATSPTVVMSATWSSHAKGDAPGGRVHIALTHRRATAAASARAEGVPGAATPAPNSVGAMLAAAGATNPPVPADGARPPGGRG